MNGFAACLAFLRGLEGHAVESLRGGDLPDHARSCRSCAARLEAAARQIRLLSGLQPRLPEGLASRGFLEQVHDRVLADREVADRPVAALLDKGLQPVAAPDDFEWPEDRFEERALQAIGRSSRPGAVDELWERVRRDVRQHLDLRRGVHRRRLRLRVAVLAAAILLGSWFASNWGTSRPAEIVFQRLDRTPAVSFSPVAVLRHAHGE